MFNIGNRYEMCLIWQSASTSEPWFTLVSAEKAPPEQFIELWLALRPIQVLSHILKFEPPINQTVSLFFFFAEGETAEHREDLQPAEKGNVSNTTDGLCFFYRCKVLPFNVYFLKTEILVKIVYGTFIIQPIINKKRRKKKNIW